MADGSTSTAAITVDSPAWGATVSGTVDVRFTVIADPAAGPASAVVSMRRLDDGYSSPLTRTVDIPVGACTESCSLEASLDTLRLVAARARRADLNQYDRLDLPITVVLSDPLGGVTKTSIVNLDNDRPESGAPGSARATRSRAPRHATPSPASTSSGSGRASLSTCGCGSQAGPRAPSRSSTSRRVSTRSPVWCRTSAGCRRATADDGRGVHLGRRRQHPAVEPFLGQARFAVHDRVAGGVRTPRDPRESLSCRRTPRCSRR